MILKVFCYPSLWILFSQDSLHHKYQEKRAWIGAGAAAAPWPGAARATGASAGSPAPWRGKGAGRCRPSPLLPSAGAGRTRQGTDSSAVSGEDF